MTYKVWYLKASHICCYGYELAGWETARWLKCVQCSTSLLHTLISRAFSYTLCSVPPFLAMSPKGLSQYGLPASTGSGPGHP